jgi:hypothetical protein
VLQEDPKSSLLSPKFKRTKKERREEEEEEEEEGKASEDAPVIWFHRDIAPANNMSG